MSDTTQPESKAAARDGLRRTTAHIRAAVDQLRDTLPSVVIYTDLPPIARVLTALVEADHDLCRTAHFHADA